jgi:hypothetical protein
LEVQASENEGLQTSGSVLFNQSVTFCAEPLTMEKLSIKQFLGYQVIGVCVL